MTKVNPIRERHVCEICGKRAAEIILHFDPPLQPRWVTVTRLPFILLLGWLRLLPVRKKGKIHAGDNYLCGECNNHWQDYT